MQKILKTALISAACSFAGCGAYFLMKKKSKNMLDIIIDEIETIK